MTALRAGRPLSRFGSTRLARKGTPYGFVAPTAILLIALMVVPIILVIGYSVSDGAITTKNASFAGLTNYVTLLTDPEFWNAALNTLIFTVSSVVAHLLIGLGFSMMLNSKLIGSVPRAFFRVIYILPWLFTAAIIAVLWRLLLDPQGVINYLLQSVHLTDSPVAWFGDPGTALLAVTVMNIWAGYPFFMISLLAGLQGVPADLYEAARVDGASPWQQFLNVTLPQLRPIIISMAMLDVLWTTQQFALIWLTTGGGPISVTEMLSTFTYKLAFTGFDFSMASASAVIVLVFSLIVAIFYVRSQRSES
ncbi:carbohydrate ABC transporter permease [Subtercola boreus]|uniref:Sugar ABC transporter permease n=1 Tax=Subtercola boreus TaxID=120213 RepID=A0A3E0WGD8_9MICO|nr:sugar ABC transporter permease [Subtercola boreus]RFA23589.1 sugar ABC transporter permease [Subtercola boreus]RFA23983.1 sugar ABC transporter permease [Subtercola boreus]RFA29681.1 sugar ABC transporter permease [Subtercola boreus]